MNNADPNSAPWAQRQPEGWAETTVGEIAEISSGFGFPERFQGKLSGQFPFAKVRDISAAVRNSSGRLNRADNFVDRLDLEILRARPVPAGSTVFAKIGEALRLNRRAILDVDAILDNNCMAVTPNERIANPEFLYRFLTTVDLSPFAVATTVPSVRRGDVQGIPLRLPPLGEQRRIVTKIDSLFAKSRRAGDQLDHVPRLVEKYKQVILAVAFLGKLTAEWRTQHPTLNSVIGRGEAELRRKVSVSDVFEPPYAVPASWRWFRLPELGNLDRGKSRHRPRNDPRLFGGSYPFVQTGDVRAADRFLTSYTETYNDFGLAQSRLWPIGTVCVTIAANIAETALLGIKACFPDSVVGLIADADKADPNYVEFFLRTARAELEAFAPATAQKNINLDTLSSIRLPMPSLEEQHEIVRRIETAFAWIGRLSSEATSALKLINHLDRSILTKAFQGELVPQDPSDEPASVLLERIRAERKATLSGSRAIPTAAICKR